VHADDKLVLAQFGPGLSMIFKYLTGEEIQKGDRINLHGEPGHIEFIANDPADQELAWFVQEYGGGVMIFDRTGGNTFITADQLPDCEDLEFVGRAAAN
jgi:hypothetical protein